MTTSSRRHVSPARARRRRSRLAQTCPNVAHHCRMVWSLTTTPRCNINSSTSRKLSGNRCYSPTQCAMISGGYRSPLYDDDAVVTTTDVGSDQATHQLDSAHRLPRHLLQPGRQLPGVHVPRDGGQWTRHVHKLPGCHRTRPRRTPPDKPARARSPTTIPAVNIAIWGRC